MNFLQSRNYFVQPTQQGIFIFLIAARKDDAVEAFIQYDGKDNALFLRTPKETILLDYINPTIHQPLLKSSFVEITEINTETEEIYRDYQVPLKQVPVINVL